MIVAYRPLAAFALAILMVGVAGAALWYQDARYALPTPRPEGLVQAPVGSPLISKLEAAGLRLDGSQPAELHFYNPDCPCSRFNLDHVRGLVRRFGDRVTFVAVVESDGAAAERLRETGLPMKVIADRGGEMASACGVYSTPQGVILDAAGRLYYRGNYNSARYCVSSETEYVRMALEALVSGRRAPGFPQQATTAYGCAICRMERSGEPK